MHCLFSWRSLAALALCVSCIPLASKFPKTKKADEKCTKEVPYKAAAMFGNVLAVIAEKHYEPKNCMDCVCQGIGTMLESLDPHSSFFNTEEYNRLQEATSGQFGGIGIQIDARRQKKDKALTIMDVIYKGPAHIAGLMPYDKIVEVDNKRLEGNATDEIMTMLRGEKGSKVHLKVLRDNYPEMLSFDITRDIIQEQMLCLYMPKQHVCYVQLSSFSANAAKKIETVIKRAMAENYRGIVLDLRNNTGGLLNAAVDIAGIFVPKNSTVVTTKDNKNAVTEEYTTNREPLLKQQIPILILVNNNTASAAEILAGCLQSYATSQGKNKKQNALIAIVIGTKTHGKASVQEVIPIGSSWAMKITTSLYFLPNDVCIQGSGVKPDFIIEKQFPVPSQLAWFQKYYSREASLKNSIKIATSDNTEKEQEAEEAENDEKLSWTDRMKKALNADNQFRESVSMINALHYGSTQCKQQLRTRQQCLTYLNSIFFGDNTLAFEEVNV